MDDQAVQELQAGYRLQQQGALDLAAAHYQKVLDRFPANEFALNLMGVACVRRGDHRIAITFLERALAVNDKDAETYNNLGLAHEALHQHADAQRMFELSLALKPRQPAVLNNLGNILAAQDRHSEAIGRFEAALAVDPAYVDCLANLSMSLLEERQHDPALRAIDRALALSPGRAWLQSCKGRILAGMARYLDAARAFEAAIGLDATLVDARIQLSTAQKQLRQPERARATLEQVLRSEPHNAEAHKCLGVLLEQTGDMAGAARHFREAIQHSPRQASAYYQLSKLSSERLTEQEVQEIKRLLDDASTPRLMRGPLCFALACELEKQGNFEESLACYTEGNRARSSDTYDPSADDTYYSAACSTFPLPASPVASSGAAPGFVPIFVLGMPRSGTTLTEQILASHSRIKGSGESGLLSDLALVAARMAGTPFPQCCARLSAAQLQSLRTRYRSGILALSGPGDFVVDKTPMNFQLIGLIALLFPEAKVIYCRRNALDNCLSIYKLPFDETQQYSHDLASLGRYYRNHARMMDFWQSIYPGWICTNQYEETVADVERQARRLLYFVGVDFEEQVLAFHQHERMVLTPSAQQVRQPIYRSSVDAWRRYGDDLQPLIAALETPASTG